MVVAVSPHRGQATTLKRNGSDFSATILGALFRSGHITIWTDVDGVYSADPRKVPEAVCLPSLTYHEAWELSYFGANVLHPRTTLPAMKYHIPISIRNFFNLGAPGKTWCSSGCSWLTFCRESSCRDRVSDSAPCLSRDSIRTQRQRLAFQRTVSMHGRPLCTSNCPCTSGSAHSTASSHQGPCLKFLQDSSHPTHMLDVVNTTCRYSGS